MPTFTNYSATRSELAAFFRIALTTADAWVQRGCPFQIKDGKRLFDLSEVEFWHFFDDKRNSDPQWREICGKPIGELLDGFETAHTRVMFHLRANTWSHPNREQIRKRLLAVSTAVEEMRNLFRT